MGEPRVPPNAPSFLFGATSVEVRLPPGRARLRRRPFVFPIASELWEDCVMAISRDEVLHVAGLARLDLSEDEIERFREQLNAILEAVGKVAELDLSDIEPTAHPLDLVNAWAEDEPRPSLSVDEALANAPDREGDFFRVPAA